MRVAGRVAGRAFKCRVWPENTPFVDIYSTLVFDLSFILLRDGALAYLGGALGLDTLSLNVWLFNVTCYATNS